MPDVPLIKKTSEGRGIRVGFLSMVGDYKPGDPPPTGYNDWHEWARIQAKAGLKQKRCGRCGLLGFPQELSDTVDESIAYKTKRDAINGTNPVAVRSPVCKKCDEEGTP